MKPFIPPVPKPEPRKRAPFGEGRSRWNTPESEARRQDRKAERFARQFHSDAFVEWVHSLGCVVPGCRRTDIDAAHVEKRSRGQRVTWRCVVPLCSDHHRAQEGRSEDFGRDHGIDLYDLANVTAQRWMAYAQTEG